MNNELISRLVRMAKDAHRDAKQYEHGTVPSSYYRGLRRGYLSSARFVKLHPPTCDSWEHYDAIRAANNNDGFGFHD